MPLPGRHCLRMCTQSAFPWPYGPPRSPGSLPFRSREGCKAPLCRFCCRMPPVPPPETHLDRWEGAWENIFLQFPSGQWWYPCPWTSPSSGLSGLWEIFSPKGCPPDYPELSGHPPHRLSQTTPAVPYGACGKEDWNTRSSGYSHPHPHKKPHLPFLRCQNCPKQSKILSSYAISPSCSAGSPPAAPFGRSPGIPGPEVLPGRRAESFI